MKRERGSVRPLALFEPQQVHGLLGRLRMDWLLSHLPPRPVWAAFMFINGFISIALVSLVALAEKTSFIFPSLGPTAFLFFFSPEAPSASPRHTILGHAIGILCGYGALWATGLQHVQWHPGTEVHMARVVAAALALASTGALMILFKAAHPPAGATTLIIALGIIIKPKNLLVIEIAVAVLTLQAIFINRIAGLDYPIWARRAKESPHEPTA
ncbi:MAG TPA: HPP family protein [Holophagaceae bacterium]|nr:HPP family protein [Holophagaceae bacterium]